MFIIISHMKMVSKSKLDVSCTEGGKRKNWEKTSISLNEIVSAVSYLENKIIELNHDKQ